jgi:hypothetical protein
MALLSPFLSAEHPSSPVHSIADRSNSSTYSEFYNALQADRPSHP